MRMKKKIEKKYLFIASLSLFPFPIFAEEMFKGAARFVQKASVFLNRQLIPFLVLLALANFIYGVVMYIKAYEETSKKEKQNRMIWGLIILFVMLSVWSLVFMIGRTFGIDSSGVNASFFSTFNQ